MKWPFDKKRSPDSLPASYYLTFRMLTGIGRLHAASDEELARIVGDLRLAGAYDITVVDANGRLISFDPG